MPRGKRLAQSDEPRAVLHRHVSLVEVSEGWLLDMIMADQTAGRLVVARLGETVAVIAPGQVEAVLARLRKLGHTPRVIGSA